MKTVFNSLTARLSRLIVPSISVNIILLILLALFFVKFIVIDNETDKASNLENKSSYQQENNVYISEYNFPDFLKNLSYTKFNINYEGLIEKYEVKTKDGISILIQKVQNVPPYIFVDPTISEFSGLSTLENMIEPLRRESFEESEYNKKIGDRYFIRKYFPYEPGCSVQLTYETIIFDDHHENVYYLRISSDWEDTCHLEDDKYSNAMSNPDIWFKNNKSKKFDLLDKFINEVF